MKIFQRVVIGLVVVWLGLSVAALLLRSMGGADRTRGMSVAAASEARRADAASRIIAWSLRPRGRAPTGIRGHVFGPDGAVEGARVCASTGGADAVAATSQCASADARGEYAIESLTAGAYFVTATAPGLALGAPPSKAPVLLVTGQVRSDLDITLHAGSRVAGTVVDALGGPIAHAELRAVALAGAQRLVSDTQSDGDGAFELWANAGALVVRAEADGYAPSAVSTVVPNNRVAMVLVPAGRIRGHVVAATSGLPVAGATVRAQASLGSLVAVMPPTAISDAEGAFEIAALAPGSYGLTAEAPGARGSSEGDVAVGLGQTIDGVVIEVALAPRVEGRVIDLDGAPCPRGSLMLGPALPGFTRVSAEQLADAGPSSGLALHAEIGVDGVATFPAVPRGRYFATVRCEDRVVRDGPVVVEVGERDVTGLVWHVALGLGLDIRVVDEAGARVPGASFTLSFPRLEGAPITTMPLHADEHGEYQTPDALYPGVYGLASEASASGAPTEVDLRAGSGRVAATLVLAGTASLRVSVRGTAGEPIDDVTVMARGDDAATPLATAIALGDGQYRVSPLRAGQYAVEAQDGINPATRASQQPIALRRGETKRTEILLARSGSLRGRVLDGRGKGIADAWVSAQHAPAELDPNAVVQALFRKSGRTLTDERGNFTLPSLVTGATYTLRAEAADGSSAEASNVREGTAVTLTLQRSAGSNDRSESQLEAATTTTNTETAQGEQR